MAFSKALFAATVAAVHSFAFAESTITAAPSPSLAARQGGVAGGPGTPALSTLTYAYSAIPEQVYPFAVLRGPQFGYNICNSTTEGPQSNCQTLIFNNVSDFCLWSSPTPKQSIGNVEAQVVAWCTQPGHGTRVIPSGAITGLQFIRTPGYIQVSGFIDDTAVNLDPTNSGGDGGELDPHGADLQGNPLGGIVYSNSINGASGPTDYKQVLNWNTFIGAGTFCFKACLNSVTSPDYCENRYDLLGCDYNMPSAVQNGTFTDCEGDVQDVVGVYTTNGVVSTWSMPDPLTPPPYTPRVPASRSCTTYSSAQLFAAAPSGSASTSSTGTSATSTPTGGSANSSSKGGASTSNTSSGSSPSKTGGSNGAASIKLPFTALGAVIGFATLGGVWVL